MSDTNPTVTVVEVEGSSDLDTGFYNLEGEQ